LQCSNAQAVKVFQVLVALVGKVYLNKVVLVQAERPVVKAALQDKEAQMLDQDVTALADKVAPAAKDKEEEGQADKVQAVVDLADRAQAEMDLGETVQAAMALVEVTGLDAEMDVAPAAEVLAALAAVWVVPAAELAAAGLQAVPKLRSNNGKPTISQASTSIHPREQAEKSSKSWT